ncbi:MAG TPA: hypothetical protein VL326_14165 [Kofleriaceae bacterium]|nr:hypothetical protein [Kofleriaceae bacterium]
MRWLVSAVVMIYAATAAAQPVAAPKPPLCLTAGATCSTVLLLETTWGVKPIVASSSGNTTSGDLALEGGLVVNADDTQGFGGSAGLRFMADAEAVPFVFRGRYRRWVSHRNNIDASVGLLLANTNRGGTGVTAQLAAERSGKIAIVLNVDVYSSHHNSDDTRHTVVEVGLAVKFCGLAGLGTGILTLLVAAAGRGTG